MSKPLHKSRWAGVFLLVGGVVLVGVGFWYAGEADSFLARAKFTEGTIIDMKRERGTKGVRQDHPVVRFTESETGDERVFKSKAGLWPSPFEVGERVEVAYGGAAPGRSEINSFWTIWLAPMVTVLFGLMCVGAGVSILRRTT